jgi:hypothetical protein
MLSMMYFTRSSNGVSTVFRRVRINSEKLLLALSRLSVLMHQYGSHSTYFLDTGGLSRKFVENSKYL